MVRRWAPVVVALLVLLVYARTLEAPFVWDDRHLVLEALPRMQSQSLGDYFVRPFWDNVEDGDSRVYFRPLTILSLSLDYAFYGENSTGFHLTNILAHWLNTLLLFALLRRYRVGSAAAGLLALSWGLHPRLTEAAAWVSGRTDVLATTGVLAALLVYRKGSVTRLLIATAFALFGLLAKEVALAGVVSLLLLVVLDAPVERGRLRHVAVGIAPVLVACFGYFLLRAIGLDGAAAEVTDLTPSERLLVVVAALGHYTLMLLVPWCPALQIGDPKNVNVAFVALGVAVAVSLGVLGVRYARGFSPSRPNARLQALGLALLATGLGLVLHVIPISLSVIAADRFLYLPLVGASLLLAPYVERFLAHGFRTWVTAAALLASFVVATSVRIGQWCNELELWTTTYFETPKSASLPGNELANIYYRAGLFEQASKLFSTTAQSAINTSGVVSNYANAQSQLGNYDEARALLSKLCAKYPRIAKFCLDTALVELQRLDFGAAEGFIHKALTHAPNYEAALEVRRLVPRVRALVEAPEYEASESTVRLAARFQVAYLAGQRPEALRLGEQLLRSPTSDPALRREAAEYWARFGPPEELKRVFDGVAGDVSDEAIQRGIEARIHVASELMQKWPDIEHHLRDHSGR